jgi:hypothetical protein
MLIKKQNLYQNIAFIISFVIVLGVQWVCRSYIPHNAYGARICLLLLTAAAFVGIEPYIRIAIRKLANKITVQD